MCSIYCFAARLQDGLKHLALSRHPVFTDANPRAEERSGLGGFELMRMSSIFPSSPCMRFSLPVMIAKKSLLPRNQLHAEPCLALHHASVSIRRLFERHGLDHRSDVLQNTEGKRILPINRRSRQAPVDRAPSKHERKRIQLDLVLRYTDHDELAVSCQTGHKCSHGIPASSGR